MHTETRNLSFFCLERAVHMVMASAAAVASSKREELDMGMPVKSHTMVWKFSRDSNLPSSNLHLMFRLMEYICVLQQMASIRRLSKHIVHGRVPLCMHACMHAPCGDVLGQKRLCIMQAKLKLLAVQIA